MYNFNNLEEMLRSGVGADEIALAFTKNLNTAIDALKPTPMQKASEELSNAWNHMMDLWIEEHGVPSYLNNKDELYIDGDSALHLFEEVMQVLNKVAPLYEAIADLMNDEEKPVIKPAPVSKNTDDDFDMVMRNFLNSIK